MAAPIVTKLVLNTRGFQQGVSMAGKGLGQLTSVAGGALAMITKLGLAFTAFGGVITALILRQAQFIDRLGKVSDVIGVNIETLQKFRFAAAQSGIGIDQADVALRRFSRRLGEAQKGTGELLPALRRLGIDTRNVDGTFKSAEEILLEFADGVANTRNESAKLALAFKAFDSEGAELVQTLNEGSAGLQAFFDRAEDLGVILDRETVAGVEDFNDALNELQTLASGVFSIFVAELAPALREVTQEFTAFVKSFKDEEGSFESLGKFLKDQFIIALVTIIQVFEKLINILAAVGNAMVSLGRAVGLSGIPELSDQAKEAKDSLDELKDIQQDLFSVGFGTANLRNAIESLAELGYNVDEFRKKFKDLNVAEQMFGNLTEGGAALTEEVNAFIKALIATVQAKYEDESAVFKGADFSSLVDLLLGNTEEAKARAAEQVEVTSDAIEEVVVRAKAQYGPIAKLMMAIFGKDKVLDFWQTAVENGDDFAAHMKALFEFIFDPELVTQFFDNVREKLAQSGVGDFMKTLEDGFVKGVSMFEDALADAIVKGKADFSDLADHLKMVLAKALVQKFITAPILGAFGLLAEGGPAKAGRPYIVGEKGPELFVPDQSGTVIPNDELGGMSGGPGIGMGGQVTYNINAVDARSFKQLVASDPEFIFSVTQAGARRVPS